MSLTRREFLSVLGIAAAVPFVEPLSRLVLSSNDASGDSPALLARLFDSIDSHLADSVHPILEVSDTRYRLPFGWIDKAQAQPIPVNDYHPPTSVAVDPAIHMGDWVSACVPTALAYKKPSTVGIARTRYWGETIQVVSILPAANAGDVTWLELDYGFTAQPTLWTQAHLWHPVNLQLPPSGVNRRAEVHRARCELIAFDGGDPVFSTPININQRSEPAGFVVDRRSVNRYRLSAAAQSRASSSQLTLCGFANHNSFGVDLPGASGVSMPIFAARALYQFLPDGAEIHVI